MNNKTDISPNHNNDSGVYLELSATIGRESQPAEDYLAGLQEVINNTVEDRLEADEFWRLQNNIYSEHEAGVITMDELVVALRILNDRRASTTHFDQAKRIIDEYGSTASIEYAIEDSRELNKINTFLKRLASIDTDLPQVAPLENYTSNTDEAWGYVDDRVIRNYLLNKTFVEDYVLDRLEINHAGCVTAIHNRTGNRDEFFEVPTRLVVSAAGFGSWLGRDDQFGNKGRGEKGIGLPDFANATARTVSLHAIKAYASWNSELPAVTTMAVYLQPGGLAYAGNMSGDSHRISAAILRGEETVKARNLRVVFLNENYYG